jgi:hypothetical protein
MLLLLDCGDYLFEYYEKHETLTDKVAIDALSQVYNELFEVPSHFLDKVIATMIINSSGYLKEVQEIFPKSHKLLTRSPKKLKHLSKVLNEVAILDLVTSDDHYALLEDLQQPSINKIGVMFFDSLLTNSMSKFLLRCPNVIGYRKISRDGKYIWEKIPNVEMYLTIVTTLHQKFLLKEAIKANYFDISETRQAGFINDLKRFKEYKYHNIHVIKFDKDDSNKLRQFLSELKAAVGKLYYHYCDEQGNNIPLVENILIMDLEKLDDSEQRKILAKISQDEYDNSLILVIVQNQIDVKDFPKVNIRVEFSYADVREINELSQQIINNRIKEFDEKITAYRTVISKLEIKKENKDLLLAKVDDFSIGGNLFNSEAVNFWYDLDLLELKSAEEIKRTVKEWEQIYYGIENKTYYKIDLDKSNSFWLIKKNGVSLKPINFNQYKGIKYLVYLFKHYSDGSKIQYDKLEEVVNNWGADEKIKLSKVSFSTVATNKSKLFEKHPEFEPIRDFLIIGSKDSGCHYIKHKKIVIELGDFEIPDPV